MIATLGKFVAEERHGSYEWGGVVDGDKEEREGDNFAWGVVAERDRDNEIDGYGGFRFRFGDEWRGLFTFF